MSSHVWHHEVLPGNRLLVPSLTCSPVFLPPELLRMKDKQIISLLEEKVHIFRDLADCRSGPEDSNPPVKERMLFRATPDDVTKGEPIMKDALREGERRSS